VIRADKDFRGGAGATEEAIRGGAGVIFQGTLTGDGPGAPLFGRPDFLVRADLLPAPDGEPRPGGYEVVDAKPPGLGDRPLRHRAGCPLE
jgi:hypothetical protein